jgi:signal transduction histidine kinase
MDLARDTTDRLSPQAAAKDITLIADFPDTPLIANAEADRIEQVLVNLLDNAIKHSPAGEKVRVSAQLVDLSSGEGFDTGPLQGQDPPVLDADQWVIISVTDAGAGIAPDDLPHIFDRFYRADQSRSRDKGGSGLGLSIARAIIEAHGGFIWLESPPQSEKMTHGTKATFALPSP